QLEHRVVAEPGDRLDAGLSICEALGEIRHGRRIVSSRPMFARIVENDRIKVLTEEAEIRAAAAAKTPIWIELEHQCKEADDLLVDVFDIHPLTIEDIWQTRSAPKLEDYR